MARCRWAGWGDINAFFGLILDNVAVMIMLVVLVTSADPVADMRFSREFVFTQMIPGTALGVVLGDLVYTWMAIRLGRRTGRCDVTAMPLGLDTPSTFAVGPLVLLPALSAGATRYGLNHGQAMVFGWHTAALVLLMVGVFKSLLAPVGGKIRSWVPRAGLLGSLAGIAVALIAFVPLWRHVAAVPIVGMVSLTMILVTLVARRNLPGKIPGRWRRWFWEWQSTRWAIALRGRSAGRWFRPPFTMKRSPGGFQTCCPALRGTGFGGSVSAGRRSPVCR